MYPTDFDSGRYARLGVTQLGALGFAVGEIDFSAFFPCADIVVGEPLVVEPVFFSIG